MISLYKKKDDDKLGNTGIERSLKNEENNDTYDEYVWNSAVSRM